MDSKFRSRKFLLAVFFSMSIVVMTFTGTISGGTFLAAMGTILGLYNAANSGIKYLQVKSEKQIEE